MEEILQFTLLMIQPLYLCQSRDRNGGSVSNVYEENTLFTCPRIIISLKQVSKATQSKSDGNTEALAYYHSGYYYSLIWGLIFTSL